MKTKIYPTNLWCRFRAGSSSLWGHSRLLHVSHLQLLQSCLQLHRVCTGPLCLEPTLHAHTQTHLNTLTDWKCLTQKLFLRPHGGMVDITCRTTKGLSLLKEGERDGVSLLFSRSVEACWFLLILSSCSSTLILVLPTSRSPNPIWSAALLGRSCAKHFSIKLWVCVLSLQDNTKLYEKVIAFWGTTMLLMWKICRNNGNFLGLGDNTASHSIWN